MIFAFTGPGHVEGVHVPRRVLDASAQKAGHMTVNVVHGYVDYLVTDNKKYTRKRVAADALGVKIIDAEEFVELIGGELEFTVKDILV